MHEAAANEDPSAPGTMEDFLASVERRAYRIAVLTTRHREDALDIVQDSMCRLVGHYRDRPAGEWPALFYRILNNALMDWHRRGRWRGLFGSIHSDAGSAGSDYSGADAEREFPSPDPDPARRAEQNQAMVALELALTALPWRQRQVFILRVWEGLDVAQTAAAMGCGEGSVKTHFFRAIHALRAQLGDHWP